MDADGLHALLAEAVADDAARARSHERMLRQAAEEEATLVGTLVDAAESETPAVVTTIGGRSHRGVAVAVATEFVVLIDEGRPPVFIPLAAIGSIRIDSLGDAAGSRPAPRKASFAAVLGGLAAYRADVQVHVAGDTGAITGTLRSAGADVVTIQVGRGTAAVMHVPVAAITDLVLLDT